MTYLCLVYFQPSAMEALNKDQKKTLDHDSLAYDRELERSGHFIVANALQPVNTARTVRVRRGKITQTDGPFAETKEQLGGFILINAANIDEATEVAAKIPMARIGAIEVRPIMNIEG